MNITQKELAVLSAILNSEYNDERTTNWIWTFSVWDNVDSSVVGSRKSLGGIIASCVAKGLVDESGRGKDATIRLTPAGLQLVQS